MYRQYAILKAKLKKIFKNQKCAFWLYNSVKVVLNVSNSIECIPEFDISFSEIVGSCSEKWRCKQMCKLLTDSRAFKFI